MCFIPQSFWHMDLVFELIIGHLLSSLIITPIAFYIEHHFVDEDSNTVL